MQLQYTVLNNIFCVRRIDIMLVISSITKYEMLSACVVLLRTLVLATINYCLAK